MSTTPETSGQGSETSSTGVIRTVSHTLDEAMRERLRALAFDARVSESSILEFALSRLFEASDASIITGLRTHGAVLRRTSRRST